MTAISLPAVRRLEVGGARRIVGLGLLAAAAALYLLLRDQWTLPHDESAPAFRTLNDARDWVDANRATNPFFVVVIDSIRQGANALVDLFISAVHAAGWPGLIAIAGTLGYVAGGLRIAVLMVGGFVLLGALGLWQDSLDTLALTMAAVALSVAVGVPLGIVAGRSRRFASVITPVLDVMQIMPTFAYLAPMALLFGIGGGAAAIATMIYAVPATIRITALGIRGVPATTLEAAELLGATRWQLLRNVQLPMSRRVIGLAINQTIMLALGMVVITVLINAPGLGEPIIRALERVNVGAAFDAGLAIVVLAVLLDRLTEHASIRLDPRFRLSQARAALRRRITIVLALGSVAAVAAGRLLAEPDVFPSAVSLSFRQPVNAVTDWVKLNLFAATDALKVGFTELFLNPLQSVLTTAPWWLVIAVVFGVGVLISGWRSALIATTALLFVAGLQLWEHGMETLASVLVATGITLVVGVLLGIWSARSNRFATGLRPVLDFAQTMPSFVYLLPAVALFGASRFTAIVAAVIYAAPPVIRLVDTGIRAVSPTILEAATASGATGRQLLFTVQLPLSRAALLLAANQGIVMVLAMVVVGGLVGAGALGYDVVAGFAQREDFGKGLAAGASIVLLGIMLDRITQGAGSRARPVRTAARRAG